jgi:chromate reductase, NAD(P)H dehydrogenase (quinone)
MKVLAISGSLRAESSNGAILRAAAALVPEGVELVTFEGVGGLPHFNPDLDHEEPPETVSDFRRLLGGAGGVVISSPEYAHGIPGSLKNALDWVVSSGELVGKPILLIGASAGGGEHVQAALAETLGVMSAHVLAAASLCARDARRRLDDRGHISDPELAQAVKASLEVLASSMRAAARNDDDAPSTGR